MRLDRQKIWRLTHLGTKDGGGNAGNLMGGREPGSVGKVGGEGNANNLMEGREPEVWERSEGKLWLRDAAPREMPGRMMEGGNRAVREMSGGMRDQLPRRIH
jgi:hypothetical protein